MDGVTHDPDSGDVLINPKPAARSVVRGLVDLALTLVVAVATFLIVVALPTTFAGPAPAGPWTAASGSGMVPDGGFNLPWIALAAGAIAGVVAALVRRLVLRREPMPRRRWALGIVAMVMLLYLSASLGRFDDPFDAQLVQTAPSAAGPMVSEVRDDGHWFDVSFLKAGEWSSMSGCDENFMCPGPRYLFRLHPGETYTFLMSVRNTSMLPVTLLGAAPMDDLAKISRPTALGLPANPASPSADPQRTVAFRPMTLWPGQSVSVVAGFTAGSCADPTKPIPSANEDQRSTGMEFAIDVVGVRYTSWVGSSFQVTVPGEECPIR